MAFDPDNLAPPYVRTLAPYVPGKPIETLEREYGVRDSIKLASNENPLGPGPLARAAIVRALEDIGSYPDGSGFTLKHALARKHGCPVESITLGNGSNEVLVLAAETFLTHETEAVYSQYAFAIYSIVVHATGAKANVAPAFPPGHPQQFGHDVDAMLAAVTPRTRLVYIANPNNPTGTWTETAALRRFLTAVPRNVLVVVDQAYFEYVDDPQYPDASAWLNDFPNLIVTRTFSKVHGLAALRVGYALSHPQIAELMNRVRQPFNVNSVAMAAACAALEDVEHQRRSAQVNREGLRQVKAGLDRLKVVHYPSLANFLLVDCGRAAGLVYESMLRQGVIVRPMGGYQLPNHMRITIGTEAQNERMLSALEAALRSA
jgi:histidinol-phosphate aminotransferase